MHWQSLAIIIAQFGYFFIGISIAQRLPELIRPIHYDLALLPILAGSNPRLCGHVYLDFEALTLTSVVKVHGSELDILDVTIGNQ